MTWTQPVVEDLKRLAESGISASQIAKELNKRHGINVSRSAVLGKINRLGITMATAVGPRQDEEEPEPEGLDVFSLKPFSCRWPISGEGHQARFCGKRKQPQYPYCAVHAMMAYRSA